MTLFDVGQAGKALFFQVQQGLRRRTREFLLNFYSIKSVWIALILNVLYEKQRQDGNLPQPK
jgi:hypothetical protein